MRIKNQRALISALVVAFFSLTFLGIQCDVFADGTETLGPPSIAIASGSGIVAAGTGMVDQPGTIDITIPDGATVNQVLLYWEGQMSTDVAGDETIVVDGNNVTGTLIGGQTFFFGGAYSSAFRADITGLGLVSAGANTLTVDELDFSKVANGAGVVVIYDDGSGTAEIGLRDGLDNAFINFPEPRKSTVPQTFDFTAAGVDRVANFDLFFSSVSGTVSGANADRPSSIEVTVGGTTTVFSNELASLDGEEWDTVNIGFPIPAGASSLTVQAFSRDDNNTGNLPASFTWTAAGLSVLPSVPEIELLKEVSVDGGVTFFDANDSASAPATAVGGGALYRLTVTNTGTSDLENVVINDAELGIVDFSVGDLAVNQTVVLTAGEIPQLDQPGRCQDPGDVTNIATVDGQSVDTGNTVSDSDPAVVRCVEEAIELLKEVSVDGGVTFFDANDGASAPVAALGGGALYRLTVTNTGTSDLENVVINDAELGIVNFPVGNLAAGQTVVLTAGEIPQLDQPGRCQDPGDVTNIATVDGQSVDTGNTVSDSDPAVVRCVEETIRLLKEVSVDGGVTFFDANDSASAPATAVGGGALYRLTVTNTGTSDLENVVINDAELGIVDFLVGNLAVNQTVVLTAGEIPQLDQPGRCQDPGDVTNIATVDGQSVDTGNTVSDSDPAVVRCVEEAIELLKEVSVDGGVTFFDANDSASAPVAALGGGALYRLTVTNTGTSDLENVVINDAELGIVDFPVGNLAAGQTVVLTAGEIPQLDQPGRCQDPGDVTNIATVDGQSVDTGNTVSDSDPAVVRCVEETIRLLKEVSVDGGVTFFDANDSASAPATAVGGGALYRLTVTNTGTSDLENVVINDAELGIVNFPVGNLAAGQTVVLTSGEIPQLEQPGRCQDPGDVTNIATVDGQSVDTGNTVSDSDPAVVRCEAGGEGCTPGYWKQTQHFDSWTAPLTPDTLFSDVFEDAFPGMTLLQVLEQGGGGLKALGRHTVAALLNAASPGVSYDVTEQGVIGMFNAVFPGSKSNYNRLKNYFEGFNEQGCPLN